MILRIYGIKVINWKIRKIKLIKDGNEQDLSFKKNERKEDQILNMFRTLVKWSVKKEKIFEKTIKCW